MLDTKSSDEILVPVEVSPTQRMQGAAASSEAALIKHIIPVNQQPRQNASVNHQYHHPSENNERISPPPQ